MVKTKNVTFILSLVLILSTVSIGSIKGMWTDVDEMWFSVAQNFPGTSTPKLPHEIKFERRSKKVAKLIGIKNLSSSEIRNFIYDKDNADRNSPSFKSWRRALRGTNIKVFMLNYFFANDIDITEKILIIRNVSLENLRNIKNHYERAIFKNQNLLDLLKQELEKRSIEGNFSSNTSEDRLYVQKLSERLSFPTRIVRRRKSRRRRCQPKSCCLLRRKHTSVL